MTWPLNCVEVGTAILKFWCKRAGRVKVARDTKEKPLLAAWKWLLAPPPQSSRVQILGASATFENILEDSCP